MNNIEKQNQPKTEMENTVAEGEKNITPEQQRVERINLIDQQLGSFTYSLKSEEEIVEIQKAREEEYQTELRKLESGLGQPLSEESKTKIHQNLVDRVIEQAQGENENYDRLSIEKIVLQNIDNPDFKKRISPLDNENISEATFGKALSKILDAEIELPRADRIKLFRQALEYYSSPVQAEKPLFHSTSSYSLRKSLEDGLAGGHGKFSGEAGSTNKEGEWIQKGLSVSHPDHPSAETFQQLFARLSARKSELPNSLAIDSEKLTGKSLSEVFVKELLGTMKPEEMKKMLAKRMGLKPEQVGDEMVEKATGEEAQKAFIDDFNKREYAPNIEKVKKEVLPNIADEKLKQELEQEAEHSFPCMITLESAGKEQHLTTVSRGENPTHIPFEDFYWDTFRGEDIREIRVPENQIKKVRGWLKEKNIENVRIVPIEIFEIKRIIQSSI
ncbi:MAG: hypothetical protein WCL23_03985 [Candidatus Moraniibacteriota bacterium]